MQQGQRLTVRVLILVFIYCTQKACEEYIKFMREFLRERLLKI